VITPQRGTKEINVENAVGMLHADILKEFRNALVWGTSVKSAPSTVGLKHLLHDEDVMQIMKQTAAEGARARMGKKTGTTLAGTGVVPDKKPTGPKKGPKS
jgi:hypothetical protein